MLFPPGHFLSLSSGSSLQHVEVGGSDLNPRVCFSGHIDAVSPGEEATAAVHRAYFCDEYMDTSAGTHAGGTCEWHRLCLQAALHVGNDFLPYKGWPYLKRAYLRFSHSLVLLYSWGLGVFFFPFSPAAFLYYSSVTF